MKIAKYLSHLLFPSAHPHAAIVPQAKMKQDGMKSFSLKGLRYAFTILSVLFIASFAFQPLAAHAYATQSITYTLCGNEAQRDPADTWTPVTYGEPANTDHGVAPAEGYKGPGHNMNKSDEVCSGDYHYGWDQYYHQATWTWATGLNNGTCSAVVYIPTWYAGAPDAHYTLTIANGVDQPITYTATIDQANATVSKYDPNGNGAAWADLPFGNNGTFVLPSPSLFNALDPYTFTVTLQNGGASWRYLGADAIQFYCEYV